MGEAPFAAAANLAGIGGFFTSLGGGASPDLWNPAGQLQVSGVTFQSVEQEGRWKPEGLATRGRDFAIIAKDVVHNPDYPLPKPDSGQSGDSSARSAAPLRPDATVGPLRMKQRKLFRVQEDADTWFEVSAVWWSDGWEIYGGFASLGNAKGFTFGQLGSTAAITLGAVPFGNYFPAAVLINWYGWFNPVGPSYYDLRGWTILQAAQDDDSLLTRAATTKAAYYLSFSQLAPPASAYMEWWERDGRTPAGTTTASAPGDGPLVMNVNPSPPATRHSAK